MDALERIEQHIRRHELIEPRRRGPLPRLRRPRLDLPLPRAPRARLPRLGAARQPRAPRRGVRAGRRALPRAARRGGGRASTRPASARPSCASSATRVATDRLRATGHTASDQVETILYRLVTSGTTKGIKPRREDGVVRPLLPLWREETEAFCRERGLEFRIDSSNPGTTRGLIRGEILPLLERIHPAARENILRALETRRTLPPALAELLDAPVASRRVDLGGGVQAVREHDRLWLERGPVELRGEVRWGAWRIRSDLPGLKVRGWRPGDRLAGRSKKIQDVFVDAKIPRSDREGWPLVVRGDEVRRGARDRRGRRDRGGPARGAAVNRTELERGVGEILIDEERLQAPDPRARARDHRRLRAAASCCSSACSRAPSSSWPT